MVAHILIVDADKSAAEVTSAMVQRIAPEARMAIERTPEGAWASMERARPDVLIIDPSSYNLAGVQMIQLLKEQYPTVRIVVVASKPTPALRAKMQSLGVDGYLEKPALLPLFIQELRGVLRVGQPPGP